MSPASLPRSNQPRAIVLGCAGTTLGQDETAFFRDFDPLGFILFARNCESPDQVRSLTAALRETVGRDAPILIDQEGGRVARLKPPHWPAFPAMDVFGRLAAVNHPAALEACRLNAQLIGYELHRLGIDVNCAPVLDLAIVGADAIISDRAFSADPAKIAALGRAMCEGLMAASIIPVIKHIPGHGRATSDSHHHLPVIDASLMDLDGSDFMPFHALNDMPWAMVAHILYTAVDAKRPATASSSVVEGIVRGMIEFDGILISDDIDMNALTGTPAERVAATLASGIDLALQCNGKLEDMKQLAPHVRPIDNATEARLARGKTGFRVTSDEEASEAGNRLKELLEA